MQLQLSYMKYEAEIFGVKDYLPPSLDPLLKDEDLQTGVSFASGGSGFDPLTSTVTVCIHILHL